MTILDLDSAFDALATTGTGSGAARSALLAGVMTDAVARASGLPLAAVRRAAMFAGDLRPRQWPR